MNRACSKIQVIGANTAQLDVTEFPSLALSSKEKSVTKSTDATLLITEIDLEQSEFTNNVTNYISGYVVKKAIEREKCEKCIQNLYYLIINKYVL